MENVSTTTAKLPKISRAYLHTPCTYLLTYLNLCLTSTIVVTMAQVCTCVCVCVCVPACVYRSILLRFCQIKSLKMELQLAVDHAKDLDRRNELLVRRLLICVNDIVIVCSLSQQ